MINEKQFATMIIMSFLKNPYAIHKPRPANKTASIPSDTFWAFFSFNILINWGKSDIAVKKLAAIPVIVMIDMNVFNQSEKFLLML